MKIRQVLDKYFCQCSPCNSLPLNENPTIQNLDTSILSLLHGNDECGKVQNFGYSEDNVVDIYDDQMEKVSMTEHEKAYYDGLASNVVDNLSTPETLLTPPNVENTPTVTETLQNPSENS